MTWTLMVDADELDASPWPAKFYIMPIDGTGKAVTITTATTVMNPMQKAYPLTDGVRSIVLPNPGVGVEPEFFGFQITVGGKKVVVPAQAEGSTHSLAKFVENGGSIPLNPTELQRLAAVESGLTSEASTRASADSALTTSIGAKADASALASETTARQNADSALTTALGGKADASALTALAGTVAGKADTSAVTAALATKADASALTAEVTRATTAEGLKADATALAAETVARTAADALKAPIATTATARGARAEHAARRFLKIMASPPTITLSAANAATGISGATIRAPKAGTGTLVDMATDPTFTWYGTPTLNFLTGGNAGFLTTPNLTGTTSNAKYVLGRAFNFYGDKFEIRFKVFSTTYDYRLKIDGEFVTENAVRLTGLTSGAVYRLTVDFGSVGPRVVEYEDQGNGFASIDCAPAHSVSAVPSLKETPTVVLGDSITAGANSGTAAGFTRIDSWIGTAAHLLGWRDVRNIALAGTGYSVAGSEAAFTSRLPDLATAGARYVVYAGLNDVTNVATTLPAAIDTVFAQIVSQSPAEFIVIGCHAINGNSYANTGYQNVNNLLASKAAGVGATFIDPFTIKPFNGTGNSTTPNGTGNADLFVNADNLHPTRAGQQYLGRAYAEAIAGSYARLIA